MLSFNLMTEKDRRAAAAIDKRRAFEEERKKRIFNTRQRVIGVDYDTLCKQIEEKKQRNNEEKEIERKFNEFAAKTDAFALNIERKEKQERIKIEKEINSFRLCCQRPEDRREFDLNDPNAIRKQKPVRSAEDDPHLGPSAAQKFEGEDLTSCQRRQAQREQIKAWLHQQMQEKEAAEKERKAAEEAFKLSIIARDARAIEIDNLEKECRRKLDQANQRFNQALINEKKILEMKRKNEEEQDNVAEIYNFLTSDMLAESPESGQSQLGPSKKLLNRGLTPAERLALQSTQLQQIEESQARKQLERKKDLEYDEYFNGIQKSIALMDKEQDRKHREQMRELFEQNKKLAEEQKLRQEFLNKVVYSNIPSDEFYSQFNKSTR